MKYKCNVIGCKNLAVFIVRRISSTYYRYYCDAHVPADDVLDFQRYSSTGYEEKKVNKYE